MGSGERINIVKYCYIYSSVNLSDLTGDLTPRHVLTVSGGLITIRALPRANRAMLETQPEHE